MQTLSVEQQKADWGRELRLSGSRTTRRFCWNFLQAALVILVSLSLLSACSLGMGKKSRAIGHSYDPGSQGYTQVDGMDETDIHISLIGACVTGSGSHPTSRTSQRVSQADPVMSALLRALKTTSAQTVYSPLSCPDRGRGKTQDQSNFTAQEDEVDSALENHQTILVLHPQAAVEESAEALVSVKSMLEAARKHRTPVILVNTSRRQAEKWGLSPSSYAALWHIFLRASSQKPGQEPGQKPEKNLNQADRKKRSKAPGLAGKKTMEPLAVITTVVDDTPHATLMYSIV